MTLSATDYLSSEDYFIVRRANGTYDTYTVEGWTERGKLLYRRPTGSIASAWWTRVSDVPKRFEVWRGDERLR